MSQPTRVSGAKPLADQTLDAPVVDWNMLATSNGVAAASPAAPQSAAAAPAPETQSNASAGAPGAPQAPLSAEPQLVTITTDAPPVGFARGDIVVYRVGTGAAALTGLATAVFVDEYSSTGTAVQSIALPTSTVGAQRTLTATGNSTAEGFLSRSSDGHLLVLSGYDAVLGAATTTAANARVIGEVLANRTVDTSHYLTDLGSGNFRSVATDTGATFYTATSTSGIRYSAVSSTTSTLLETAITNSRTVELYAGQLYDTAMSGTSPMYRVSTVGTGEQTGTGNAVTNLPGVAATATSSPYAIFLADLSSDVAGVDTLYVADDASAANGGGIQKYSLVSGSWVSNGVIADASVRGLTGAVSGSSVTLYATTASSLDAFVDTSGYNGTLAGNFTSTHLATAATNTAFRGVALAPQATAGLTIGNASVTEGDSGTTPISFIVTRDAVYGAASVNYAVSFGTGAGFAAANDLSGTTSGTVSFADGEASKVITLNVVGDTTVETNETFSVVLSSPTTGYTLVSGTGTGTIVNDDLPSISVNNLTLAEGNSGSSANYFNVMLSAASTQTVTANYHFAEGSATGADNDYSAPADATITFAPGETSKLIPFTVYGDTKFETSETLTINLSSPTNATISAATGTATITNDDPLPTISINSVAHLEGPDEEQTYFDFTISLSNPSSQYITVAFATADGTATGGSDYETYSTRILGFNPGETSFTFTVNAIGDEVFEPDETFSVVLSSPTNATISSSQGTGTGTILNDDPLPTISVNSVAQDEYEDEVEAYFVFTITLSNASSQPVTVQYRTADGTATAGSDYTAASGSVTFRPGEISRDIVVYYNGDDVYEPDETFSFVLSSPTNATISSSQGTGTGTIVNDDPLPVISVDNVVHDEGNSGTTAFAFTVSLATASSQSVTVKYATADGTATAGSDYAAASGTLTFAPGVTSQTVTVQANGDMVFEPNETFALNLSSPTNATISSSYGAATGTIANDDAAPAGNGALSIAAASGAEGSDGRTDNAIAFTVTRANGSAGAVSATYTVSNGTTDAADFGGTLPTGTVNFADGQTSATVTVNVTGDLTYEPNETFAVALSSPTGGATLATASATGTITNDDPIPTISINSGAVPEGTDGEQNDFRFSVTLSNPSSQVITVNVATADGTATQGSDYDGSDANGQLVFNPGETSATIFVHLYGDDVVEQDETFSVVLSSPSNATISSSQGIGTGTILNDDFPPAQANGTLSIDNVTHAEGNSGATDYTFTVTRTGGSDGAVSVAYAFFNDGTTDNADFTAPPGSGTVAFAAGETSKTITISVAGDTVYEANESFSIQLFSPTGGATLGASSGRGIITNDDPLPVISVDSVTHAEGNSGTTAYAFTVSLANASYQSVTVNYATADGTATAGSDYAAASGTLTFAPGVTSQTVTVQANGDMVFEPNETFALNLSSPTNATIAGNAGTGTGTILNDDPAPAANGALSIDSVTHAEGNSGATAYTFTVTRSGGSDGAVTAAYTFANGTTDDDDFTAPLGSGTVAFAAGETSKTITVSALGDTAYEANETFSVTLSNATGGATLGTTTGTGTITNDDPLPTISVSSETSGGEGGTQDDTAYGYVIALSNPSSQTVTVHYATADGTATAGSDYGANSGTVTFAPGEISQTIFIPVYGDEAFEPDETFSFNLSSPTNATIASGQGTSTFTILNDDPAPAANGALSIDSVTHAEGNSGATAYTFTVTRSGGSDGAVSAAYTFANGTTTDADFTAPLGSGTVAFAAGETSKTITVSAVGDAVYEANETFSVTLSNATGGATLGNAVGTGTITNDDPLPMLTIGDPVVVEGNSGTTLLTYTVTASSASSAPITFDIATANGTATAGSDYVANSVTGATIAAGQTSYTFSVTVNGDTVAERNETVLVNLTNASGATIADAQGVGTIRNDDGVPAPTVIFSENFTGFTAAGFAPTPGAGQLDSDIWRVVGLSDIANPAYGFTGPAGGDFGRGVIATNVTTAGVYSPGSATGALILQPTGAEIEGGGFIEAKIQNTTGFTAASFQVAFDWQYRNNETRGENMQLAYSTDGVTFTVAPAANFSTPLAPVAGATFVNQHEDVTISNLFVGDQGYLYLRWVHVNSSGAGSRDEVGIDNVSVTGTFSATNVGVISDISVNEGNSGTTAAVFTITRSGDQGTASIDYATANGTAVAGIDYAEQHGTVTFADGETAKTVTILVTGDTAHEADETVLLNLSNPVGLVLPDAQGKLTIVNDDNGPVAIYDIQGRGIASPLVGVTVTTHGVVTAVDTNGFYLQDATGDNDIATSDGIFVFTTTAPTVVVGNEIDVTGKVQEFVGSTAGSASTTELTTPTNIVVTNQSVALPAAVLISTDGTGRAPPTQVIDDDGNTSYDPTTDGFDFYESLEGMRVTIQTPRVVANTDSFGETYVVASNGVGATGLNDRSGMTISAGDNNPETIVITRDAGVNASYVANHVQGDVLGNVTGVLQYQFAQYQLIVTDPTVTTTTHGVVTRETTTLVGDATHLSYASFNVENLASVPDSTVTDRNTQAKVDAAFAAHANEVVNALKSPDIIGLQEVQDADGIGNGTDYSGTATANKLIAAIVAAGGPTYVYIEVAPTANNASGGEPGGNIRPGFLYNPARVSYVDGSAMALNDPAYAGTRKPLFADFMFNGQKFTAVDLHSTSRGGSDPLYGANQPPTQLGDGSRTSQSAAVASYIAAHPGQNFVVNGDFNGYYYEDALKTLESSSNVPGGTGMLNNLITLLPVQERYTYYFGGYYQAFDNILVSNALNTDSRFDVVHYNAGFTDGVSATDHDQVVATIAIGRNVAAAVAVADAFTATETSVYRGTVLANDTGGGAGFAVTAVNGAGAVGSTVRLASGATVVVNADGTFAYNTDGAFSALATGQTGNDSFTYTLNGGSTATVTVKVQGVTNSTPSSANDMIAGTPAADYFDLSTGGNDTVSGGAGDDGFFFGAAFTAADHVDGGSGTNDQVGLLGNYTGSTALTLGANTITGIEAIAVQPGYSYNLTTVDANVSAGQTLKIYGSSLAAGNDLTFNGSAETDGMFIVYGGMGADNITTGAGNDGIYFGQGRFNPATDHIDGGAGINDQFALDGSYTVTIARANVVNVETVVLLDGQPAAPANYIVTLADDWTQGGEVHTVYAVGVRNGVTVDASAETGSMLRFFGGSGADVLTGGAAGNWFDGGAGADTMKGGAGVDTFNYGTAANSMGLTHDTIVNFDSSLDKIDLPFAITGIDADRTGSLSNSTFDDDLTAALTTLGANHAVQFTVTGGGALDGRIFEVIDANGVAGYQAGQDMVIELTTPINGAITAPGVFI